MSSAQLADRVRQAVLFSSRIREGGAGGSPAASSIRKMFADDYQASTGTILRPNDSLHAVYQGVLGRHWRGLVNTFVRVYEALALRNSTARLLEGTIGQLLDNPPLYTAFFQMPTSPAIATVEAPLASSEDGEATAWANDAAGTVVDSADLIRVRALLAGLRPWCAEIEQLDKFAAEQAPAEDQQPFIAINPTEAEVCEAIWARMDSLRRLKAEKGDNLSPADVSVSEVRAVQAVKAVYSLCCEPQNLYSKFAEVTQNPARFEAVESASKARRDWTAIHVAAFLTAFSDAKELCEQNGSMQLRDKTAKAHVELTAAAVEFLAGKYAEKQSLCDSSQDCSQAQQFHKAALDRARFEFFALYQQTVTDETGRLTPAKAWKTEVQRYRPAWQAMRAAMVKLEGVVALREKSVRDFVESNLAPRAAKLFPRLRCGPQQLAAAVALGVCETEARSIFLPEGLPAYLSMLSRAIASAR